MIKKDYIHLKHLLNNKKKNKIIQIFTIIKLIIVNIILIIFTITVLYNTHHKKKILQLTKNIKNKNSLNELPPKPKIQWHYIKELEEYDINLTTNKKINNNIKK
ncbi:hypothetical protein [Candidatus Providencia siddallii]|uniref:Cell division protein FtsN, partial n=1 Tax=Candidatus Providencia siddallii TaxID=1715285 RepID=A0ABP1CG76_9GAMM